MEQTQLVEHTIYLQPSFFSISEDDDPQIQINIPNYTGGLITNSRNLNQETNYLDPLTGEILDHPPPPGYIYIVLDPTNTFRYVYITRQHYYIPQAYTDPQLIQALNALIYRLNEGNILHDRVPDRVVGLYDNWLINLRQQTYLQTLRLCVVSAIVDPITGNVIQPRRFIHLRTPQPFAPISTPTRPLLQHTDQQYEEGDIRIGNEDLR